MAPRNPGSNSAPLVVIVGATASGKTALAIELAKRFNGEIICADSRTVYKGMDIGTAKPTTEERQGIPHYGLDEVEPGESFTAYDFQQLAYRRIAESVTRGKLPIIVGGTGLYIDGVLYGFTFRALPSAAKRAELQGLSVEILQQMVVAAGYDLPASASNKRHLTRLLESGPAPKQDRILRPRTLVVGLRLPDDELKERITLRVAHMFDGGLVNEVQKLLEHYGSVEALRAPCYKAVAAHLSGKISLQEAKTQCIRADLDLAKRQRTWFKRNADIHWLSDRDTLTEAVDLITTLLDA